MKFWHILVVSAIIAAILRLTNNGKPRGDWDTAPIKGSKNSLCTGSPFLKSESDERGHETYGSVSGGNCRAETLELGTPAYVEMLDWANDEYWEIQELNGKYYRVLKDGAFEEMDVYEEYEYEEEIGDIEDLYRYANENKSRIVKAIRKR